MMDRATRAQVLERTEAIAKINHGLLGGPWHNENLDWLAVQVVALVAERAQEEEET